MKRNRHDIFFIKFFCTNETGLCRLKPEASEKRYFHLDKLDMLKNTFSLPLFSLPFVLFSSSLTLPLSLCSSSSSSLPRPPSERGKASVVARYPINSLDRVGEKYDNLRIRDLGLAVYTSPPSFFLFLCRRRASFPFLRPLGRSLSSSDCQVKHGRPARAI